MFCLFLKALLKNSCVRVLQFLPKPCKRSKRFKMWDISTKPTTVCTRIPPTPVQSDAVPNGWVPQPTRRRGREQSTGNRKRKINTSTTVENYGVRNSRGPDEYFRMQHGWVGVEPRTAVSLSFNTTVYDVIAAVVVARPQEWISAGGGRAARTRKLWCRFTAWRLEYIG